MDAFVHRRGRTVHEVGLADLLDMARLTDCLPRQRALIGIEPLTIGWGVVCTEPVSAALPSAVAEAFGILAKWQSPSSAEDVAGVA